MRGSAGGQEICERYWMQNRISRQLLSRSGSREPKPRVSACMFRLWRMQHPERATTLSGGASERRSVRGSAW